MSKIYFKQSDDNRVILTDTLPYETPIIFSNEGFYDYISYKSRDNFINDILINAKESTHPYLYIINKNSNSKRTLAVAHPACQYKVIDIYKKYALLFVSLCGRSDFSLRYPSSVASAFYDNRYVSNEISLHKGIETELEIENPQQKFASSYFSYQKYNFLYKFFDSYEFHSLEKKFSNLYTLDLSKCFPSIYTHSISWAIKGKQHSKKNKNDFSFDDELDRTIRSMNENETHGIIIGPEISRIFAEIILQTIDVNILKAATARKIEYRNHFSIKRYVDDYFLFYNDENVRKDLLEIIEEELDKYKLYINKAKCFEMKRPFMTSISVAKIESVDYLRVLNHELFCYIKGSNNELVFEKEIRYQTRFSGTRISALKAIIKHNDVSYEHISRICISRLCKMFSVFCRKSFASIDYIANSSEISKRIWILLDISFFIYSMDINPRTTHIISRLIFNISKFCENLNKSDSEDVQKKIFDESLRCIELCSRQSSSRVEISNLFIALTFLQTPFIIPESLFIDVFDLNNSKVVINRLDYFSLITILLCIKDRTDVSELRRHVISRIKEILNCANFMTNTESVLTFFDTVSCPHIGKQDKIDFTSIVFDKMGKGSLGGCEVRRVVNLIASQTWFIDWSAHKNFENLLHKKELRTPY